MAETILRIKGMSCGYCVKEAQDALFSIDGVEEIHISLKNGSARIIYDESRANIDQLTGVVNNAGFQVSLLN